MRRHYATAFFLTLLVGICCSLSGQDASPETAADGPAPHPGKALSFAQRLMAEAEVALAELEAKPDQRQEWSQRVSDMVLALRRGKPEAQGAEALHVAISDRVRVLQSELDWLLTFQEQTQRGLLYQEVRRSVPREGGSEVKAATGGLDLVAERQRWLPRVEARADRLYRELRATNRDRSRLLQELPAGIRRRQVGLGADGIHQVWLETEHLNLVWRYQGLAVPVSALALIRDIRTSPAPVVVMLFQIALVLVVFVALARRSQSLLDPLARRLAVSGDDKPVANTFAALVVRAHRPLEWILLLIVLLALVDKQYLPEVQWVRIILRWVFGVWLLILLVDVLVERATSGGRFPVHPPRIRKRTELVLGLALMGVGTTLSIVVSTVGSGALYLWLLRLFVLIAIPCLALVVGWWKEPLYQEIRARKGKGVGGWLARRTEGRSFFLPLGVFFYLILAAPYHWARRRVAGMEETRRMMARLARRGLARDQEARGEPISGELEERLLGGSAGILDHVARDEVQELVDLGLAGGGAIVAVYGERGIGKTVVLRRVAAELGPRALWVSCPVGGFNECLAAMAEAVGAPDASPSAVLALLRSGDKKVICLDDIHYLIRPAVGGLASLDRLAGLVREAGPDLAWIVTLKEASWQFLDCSRRDRVFIERALRLPPWNEAAIGELLETRSAGAGIDLEVLEKDLPNGAAPLEDRDQWQRRNAFFRVLWDYADGNPSLALYFWAKSLVVRDGELRIRMFREPDAAELEAWRPGVRFVMRAVLQLDRARLQDVAESTQLPPMDVSHAIRLGVAKGHLEEVDGRYRVTLRWHRAITRMLVRQRLLAQ